MFVRKLLNLVLLILIPLCLTLGYAKIGPGMAFTAGLFILGAWLLAHRWPQTWFPSIALVVTVCLAVIELYQGASAPLMLVAAALALANWDLALLNRLPAGSPSFRKLTLLETKHYQSLLLALGLAIPASLIGRIIHFQIPFGIMILLVILAFFSLTRVWSYFLE
jgi:hypothetical protein